METKNEEQWGVMRFMGGEDPTLSESELQIHMKPEEYFIYGLTTDNGLCFISHLNIHETSLTQ